MKFEKSKVYSALNAEDLPIGSKCIFADTVRGLQKRVQNETAANYVEVFVKLYNNGADDQFVADCYTYNYAYLIEPPSKPKYRPFESVEKAMDAIKKHGGWVKDEGAGCTFLVLGYGKHKEDFSIYIGSEWASLEDLFIDYVFADDGSPCGELVER